MQLLECEEKITQKEKEQNVDGSRFCVFMCGQIQEITNILLHNRSFFTFVQSHIHTKDIFEFCECFVPSFLNNKII